MLTGSDQLPECLTLVGFKKFQAEASSLTLKNLRDLVNCQGDEEWLMRAIEAWVDRFIMLGTQYIQAELNNIEMLSYFKSIVKSSLQNQNNQQVRLAKFALAQLESQVENFFNENPIVDLLKLRIKQSKEDAVFTVCIAASAQVVPPVVLDEPVLIATITPAAVASKQAFPMKSGKNTVVSDLKAVNLKDESRHQESAASAMKSSVLDTLASFWSDPPAGANLSAEDDKSNGYTRRF